MTHWNEFRLLGQAQRYRRLTSGVKERISRAGSDNFRVRAGTSPRRLALLTLLSLFAWAGGMVDTETGCSTVD